MMQDTKRLLNDYEVDYWNRWANEWQSVHVQAHNYAEAKAMVWFKYMKPANNLDGSFRPISEIEADDIHVHDYSEFILKPTEFNEHELDSTIDLIKQWVDSDE